MGKMTLDEVKAVVEAKFSSMDKMFEEAGYSKVDIRPVNRVLAVVGYLSYDQDCENPLDDWDGTGKLYSRLRHSDTESEFYGVFGRDRYGDPDLSLADDHADEYREEWIEAAIDSDEFGKDFAEGKVYGQKDGMDIRSVAGALFDHPECDPFDMAYDFVQDVRERAWENLLDRGIIGDSNAVALDYYEHGNSVWSIHGHGPQCDFDTSRMAGVWVPETKDMVEETERRVGLFSRGRIETFGGKSSVTFLDGSGVDKSFDKPWEAFEYLVDECRRNEWDGYVPSAETLKEAKRLAPRVLAEEYLSVYNDWLSGSCFGVIHMAVQIVDGEPVELDSEHCWGFVGREHAEESMEMDYWVKEFERRWLEETVPARMGITGQGLVFMDQEARGFDGPAKIHWELGEDGWAGTLSGDQLPSVLVSGVNAPGDAARAGAAVLAIDRLSKE